MAIHSLIPFVRLDQSGKPGMAYLHSLDGILLLKKSGHPAWTMGRKTETFVHGRIAQSRWMLSDIAADSLTDEVKGLLAADDSVNLADEESANRFLAKRQARQAAQEAYQSAAKADAWRTLGIDPGSVQPQGAAPSPFEKAQAAPSTFRVATAACPKGKDMTVEAIQGLVDQEVKGYVLEDGAWIELTASAALREAGLSVIPASPFQADKLHDAAADLDARIAAAVAAALADRG